MWAAVVPKENTPSGYKSPQPGKRRTSPSKPASAIPPRPLSSPKRERSQSFAPCFLCEVFIFALSLWAESVCVWEGGAGYFLLLCIFLLNWEGFHFLPKLSVLPCTDHPGLETTLPVPPKDQENGELIATGCPHRTLQPLRSKRKRQPQQSFPWGRCPGVWCE